MSKKKADTERRILNRKARHNFHIHETFEAGIVLTGSEVKSLRAGQAQITEAFVRITGDELMLYAAQIDRYPHATTLNHDPKRDRKLLMHKREISKLQPKLDQSGFTLIPLSIYFNSRGLAKVELGLATGKRLYDKREDLRKKTHQREITRAMSRGQK